jgi:hypothetical protein
MTVLRYQFNEEQELTMLQTMESLAPQVRVAEPAEIEELGGERDGHVFSPMSH